MRLRRRPGKPRSTWLGRLARGWRPDRNPLRRRSDRVETAVMGVLVAAFAVGAPFAWHAAGSWTYAASAREQHAQSAAWREVPATLLQAAPSWSGDANAPGTAPEVKARWKAPDGRACTGLVYAPSSGAAGSTVMVWVNQAGQLTGPPLQSSEIAGRTDMGETAAVAALAFTLIALAGLVHWALGRRRIAAWDADWLATGPRWSQRR